MQDYAGSAVGDNAAPRRGQVLVCLLIIAAVIIFSALDPRRTGGKTMGGYEDAFFEMKLAHAGDMLRQAGSSLINLFGYSSSQALFGCPLGPGLNEVVGIVVLGLAFWLLRRRMLWGLWVITSIVMMLVMIKPLDRYYLAVLPLLVFAWWNGLVWVNRHLKAPRADYVFLGLFLLGGATNLSRIGEFVVEQHRSPFLTHYKEGHFACINRAAALVVSQTAPGDWLLVDRKMGRTFTFLTRRYAVDNPAQVPVDPAVQPVYLLQPVDKDVQSWVKERGYGLSARLGKVEKWQGDPEPWTLHRLEPPPLPPVAPK